MSDLIKNLEYLIQFLPGKSIYAEKTLTCDDGAFVWYHTGETAAKTRYEDLYPISNEHYIVKTALGGEGEG